MAVLRTLGYSVVVCLMSLATSAATVSELATSDDRALIATTTLAGAFTQTIYDDRGSKISGSEGVFALLKPSYLRWETLLPGQQLLLTDGSLLWQYDKDLETVTKQYLDAEVSAPLQLLIAPKRQLVEHYQVVQSESGSTVTLTPRSSETAFASLILERDAPGGELEQLIIHDNLGQKIVVVFSELTEPPLTPDFFDFDPPEGLDVTTIGS